MKPRVAVIVVNWNSGGYLRRCLDSLAMQTRVPDRTVVVDNASSDDSLRAATGCMAFESIVLERNMGFAAANNIAIHHVEDCDLIALLNPDAFAEPDWLESLLRAAASHPDHASFGSRQMTVADPRIVDGVGDVYHFTGLPWRAGHGRPVEAVQGLDVDRDIFSPCAAAALYRRESVLAVGAFDEDYFCYSEDVDLGFRLRLAGYRCRYVADAIVHHVGAGTTSPHSPFALYHGHRNLVWTYFKDMPLSLLLLFIPFHFALNLITIAWFSLHGHGTIILRAKRDALAGIPGILRKRATVRSLRRASLPEIVGMFDFGLMRK